MLLANETTSVGVVPDYFWTMMAALVAVNLIMAACFTLGWRLIDWITPGNLANELVPPKNGEPAKPNMPLAVVVSALIGGWCLIQAAIIIGVLLH